MIIDTVFICDVCGQRIKYDYEAGCYLQHDH